MIDTSFLDQLHRFSLVVHKRVTSNYTGPRRSIAPGRGLIFKDHRIYAPGDDFRSIDWKVYARTDDLYIKNYEEERNLVVHSILDHSASMKFGKKISKFDYGAMLGIGFGYLAMKENEKFRFSTFGEGLNVFQQRKGMSQVAAMVDYLNSVKTSGDSKLLECIMQYRKFIGSRALIVLISDFLIDLEEIKEAFYHFGNNQVKILQILDPVEKGLSLVGDYDFRDSETGFRVKSFVTPRLRENYRSMLDKHCNAIQEHCNTLGYEYHLITTNTPIFDAFYKILA